MDDSFPLHHTSPSRPEVVKTLAAHLLRYPYDIVDAKRLIQHFQASALEFNHALRIIDSQQAPRLRFI